MLLRSKGTSWSAAERSIAPARFRFSRTSRPEGREVIVLVAGAAVRSLAALVAVLLTVHMAVAAVPCLGAACVSCGVETERLYVLSDDGEAGRDDTTPLAPGHVAKCKDHCTSLPSVMPARMAVVSVAYAFDFEPLPRGIDTQDPTRPPR